MTAQTTQTGCGGQQTNTTVNTTNTVTGQTTTTAPLAACQQQPAAQQNGGGAPPPPQITPEQAAAQAIAKLKFTAAAPGMGPDHGDNQLQDDETGAPFDAPVGYPIWLWAEGGDTAPRAVNDTEGGLAVAINIKLDGIIWTMGDGISLDCGVGTPWIKGSTKPGSESPTCGHVYEKTGDYTVTATTNWTIEWQAGGQTGNLPFAISRSRPYDVGELQVIVQ